MLSHAVQGSQRHLLFTIHIVQDQLGDASIGCVLGAFPDWLKDRPFPLSGDVRVLQYPQRPQVSPGRKQIVFEIAVYESRDRLTHRLHVAGAAHVFVTVYHGQREHAVPYAIEHR